MVIKKTKAQDKNSRRLGNQGTIAEVILGFFSSRAFLNLTIAWFVFQAIYMALSTKFGIPPDERYHLTFIQLFADKSWMPFLDDQEGYLILGEVVRTPYFLYHYLLSLPYRLFAELPSAYIILRLVNIGFAVGSLFMTARLANFMKLPPLVRNLTLFMLANTLMFVFLSASINYDNLLILLSLILFYLLFVLMHAFTLMNFMLFITVLLAGSLVKISFLPIALVTVLVLIVSLIRGRFNIIRAIGEEYRSLQTPLGYILVGSFLILATLATNRYGLNLLYYRTLVPKCDAVLQVDQCRQNPIYARSERLDNMDRPPATKGNIDYVASWVLLMQERTYGIFAHQTIKPTTPILIGAQILFLLGLAAIVRKFSTKDKHSSVLFAIIAFYTAVLIFTNHTNYQRYGSFTFAVQGRYYFVVLPLLYIIGNMYILKFNASKILRLIYVIGVVTIFASASLPSYIYVTDSSWHTPRSVGLNRNLKNLLIKLR